MSGNKAEVGSSIACKNSGDMWTWQGALLSGPGWVLYQPTSLRRQTACSAHGRLIFFNSQTKINISVGVFARTRHGFVSPP